MLSALLIKIIQNPIFISVVLSILVAEIIYIYFWNYLRVCYYASKLPGPTAYPIIGNLVLLLGSQEEMTRSLIGISKKYQNSMFRVWIGPIPMILTSDPLIVQEILTNEHALEKPYIMKLIFESALGNSIFISEVPEWKHHRSIIIRGFTPIILKSYFKIFVEKINILTQKLDLQLNKETSFDIFEYLSRTTLDSVCGSTMGINTNSFEESSYLDAIESALHLLIIRAVNIFKIPNILYQFTSDYKSVSKNRKIIKEFAEKIISEKQKIDESNNNNNLIDVKAISKNEYKKPFLEYLMDFAKNNQNITNEQLRDEATIVIFGAYETSAISLSYVLLQLAVHKEIQNKVYNEILEVLGETTGDSINFDDLPKLKYMEMVIKESMRINSTGPAIGRQLSQDIKIGDRIIPKGATVIIPIFTIHRNDKYWENPLKFDPERFTPENIKNRHPYAYIPFSAGPRNCIGMRYAWILMKTTLATLLSRYEFHTDLNLNELKYEFAATLKLVNGHQVRITPRQKPNGRR